MCKFADGEPLCPHKKKNLWKLENFKNNPVMLGKNYP